MLGSPKTYSAEEADHELFGRFAHDIAQCLKALQFLRDQSSRISAKYWPKLFSAFQETAFSFERLFGENALYFDELPLMYSEFDRRSAHSAELLTVHPKERTFSVASLHAEVAQFRDLVFRLENEISSLSDAYSRELAAKVSAISVHLKHIQSRIKLRDTLHQKCVKLEKKVAKLEKKLLSAQEKDIRAFSTDLDENRAKVASTSARYTALNTKLKTTLPESLLLVEEFVSSVVNWSICRQREIAGRIADGFRVLCQDYGYSEHSKIPEPEDIVNGWESAATPTRLRVESLLSAIYNKHPDLLNEEISAKDNSSKVNKVWSNLTSKVREKHHEVKPKDKSSGIFHDHQMADPLRSYIQYVDPGVNLAENYHPTRMITRPQPLEPSARKTPPPLPPRDEGSLIRMRPAAPVSATSSKSTDVPKTPPSADGWMPHSWGLSSPLSGSAVKSSVQSPHSESQLSLASEENTVLSSIEDAASENLFSDIANEKLVKLYNAQKNEITEAPIYPSRHLSLCDKRPASKTLTDPNNSTTLKILELQHFYEKLLALDLNRQVVTAKESFGGAAPGDLSFNAGDPIEVVFDLQSNIMTYDRSGENWFVGATSGAESRRRVGFAPNTYF